MKKIISLILAVVLVLGLCACGGKMTEKQINKGLNDEQVALSRQKHGSNKMTAKNNKTFFSLFLENLKDPVIRVLILSLIINILFTMRDIDWFETGGIALAILLATSISYHLDRKIERLSH